MATTSPKTFRRQRYEGLSNQGAGIQFVLTITVFTLAGMGLDAVFGTRPTITIALGVIGFVGGFARVMYHDHYEAAWRKAHGKPELQQREVPYVLAAKTAAADRERLPGDVDGIEAYDDWRPRRFGDPVPESLATARQRT